MKKKLFHVDSYDHNNTLIFVGHPIKMTEDNTTEIEKVVAIVRELDLVRDVLKGWVLEARRPMDFLIRLVVVVVLFYCTELLFPKEKPPEA